MTRQQYLAKRQQLMNTAKGYLDAGDIEKFNAAKAEVEALDSQYEQEATARANFAALQGGAGVPGGLQNLNPSEGEPQDMFASREYAQAFMNYATRSEPIPSQYRSNAAASTGSADAAAVIPTTWMNEIIRNLKERGIIFQQLRHLNVPGGVEIPILDLAPTASWVGDGASEDQKLSAKETVSFSCYGLECKISQSLLVSAASLEEFQSLFVELATEAVIAAVEKGVFSGTGNGQMLGVCKDPRVKNVVELTAAEFAQWSAWKKKVFAKIPLKYRTGKFFMALGTFEGYIDGMTDTNGQPVGRCNYGIADAHPYRFGGKDVQPVEADVLPDFESAADGDVVAVFMDLKNYIFNSTMTMTVVSWVDNDNNKKKTKVMLICDGKAADTNGIVLVKKKAAA